METLGLTDEDVANAFAQYELDNEGWTPTLEEVSAYLGCARHSIHPRLARMVEHGLLETHYSGRAFRYRAARWIMILRAEP